MTEAPYYATCSTVEALDNGLIVLRLEYAVIGIEKRIAISTVAITDRHATELSNLLRHAIIEAKATNQIEDGMRRLDPVEDEQMDSVADWEMAKALFAHTFNYPVNVNEEWTKLIHGPDWLKAEGFKRMARKCREALYARNLRIINNDSKDQEAK